MITFLSLVLFLTLLAAVVSVAVAFIVIVFKVLGVIFGLLLGGAFLFAIPVIFILGLCKLFSNEGRR